MALRDSTSSVEFPTSEQRRLCRDWQHLGIWQTQHLKKNGKNGGTSSWLPPLQIIQFKYFGLKKNKRTAALINNLNEEAAER